MARNFRSLRGRTQSQASSMHDGKSNDGKSQTSGASSRREDHNSASYGLGKNAAHAVEMIFGILYVMLKTDEGKNKYAWVPELVQLVQLLYFPLYTYSWGALASGTTTGFGTSLPSSLSWINWSSWGFKTFAVVFWISVAFCMISLVTSAIVGYQFGQHRIRFIWPLKILRRAVTVLLDLLYIPILQIMTVMFNCNFSAAPHLSYPADLTCWDGAFLLYFGFAIVSVLVTSALSLAVGLLFFEPDPRKSRSVLQARPHSRVEFVYLVATIVLSIAKGLKMLKELHLGIIYFLVGLGLMWLMLNFYPYYNLRMNCYRMAGFATFTWLSIFVIVENQNNAYAGPLLTAVMLAGAIPIFGIAWWGAKKRFFMKYCNRRAEAEFARAFHVELATRFLQEDTSDEALDLAEGIFQSGIAQFPKSSAVYVAYAQFLFFYRENSQQGFEKVRTAAKLRPFLDMRFFVYRKMNERQQLMHAAEVGSKKLDVIGYIEYVKNMSGARKGHRQCLRAFQQFWAYIMDPQTPLRSLERAITKIDRTEKEAQFYYRTLLEQHPHNPRILRLYGRFLEECHNDPAKAQEHYDLADEYEEQHAGDFNNFRDDDEEAGDGHARFDAPAGSEPDADAPAEDGDDGGGAGAGVGAGAEAGPGGPRGASPKPMSLTLLALPGAGAGAVAARAVAATTRAMAGTARENDDEIGDRTPPHARSPNRSRDGDNSDGGSDGGGKGPSPLVARKVPAGIAMWLEKAADAQTGKAPLRDEAIGIGLSAAGAGGGPGANKSGRVADWMVTAPTRHQSIDANGLLRPDLDPALVEEFLGANLEAPGGARRASSDAAGADASRRTSAVLPDGRAGPSTRRTAGLSVAGAEAAGSRRPSAGPSQERPSAYLGLPENVSRRASTSAGPARTTAEGGVIADLVARFSTLSGTGEDGNARRMSSIVADGGGRRSSVLPPRESATDGRRVSVAVPRESAAAPGERRTSTEHRRQSVAYGLGTAIESLAGAAAKQRRPSRRMSTVGPPAKGPAQTAIAVDGEGYIRAVDPSFATFFGCGFEEAVGAPLAEFVLTATVAVDDEEGAEASASLKQTAGVAPNTLMRPVKDSAFVPRIYPSAPVALEAALGDDTTATANVVALPRYGRPPYAGTLAISRAEATAEAALLGAAFSVVLRKSAVEFRVVTGPRGAATVSPSLGPLPAPPSPHAGGGSSKNRSTFLRDESLTSGPRLPSLEGFGGIGPPTGLPRPAAPRSTESLTLAAVAAAAEAPAAKAEPGPKEAKKLAGKKSSLATRARAALPAPPSEGEGAEETERTAGEEGGGRKKLVGRVPSKKGLSFGRATAKPGRKASVTLSVEGPRRGSLAVSGKKPSLAGSTGGGSRVGGRKASLAGSVGGGSRRGSTAKGGETGSATGRESEGRTSEADSAKAAKRMARIQKLKRRVAEAQKTENSGVITRLGRVALLVTFVVAGAALGMYFFITALVDDYSNFMDVVALSAGRRRYVIDIMYYARALQLLQDDGWPATLSFTAATARQTILDDAGELEKSHLTLGDTENAKSVTLSFYRLASGGSREVIRATDSIWNVGLLFIDAARGVAKASDADLVNPAAANEHLFFVVTNGANIFAALDRATVNDQRHAEGLLAQVKLCLVLVVVGVVGLLSALLFVVLWATVRKVEVEKEKAIELFYDIPKSALVRMAGKSGRRRQEEEDDEEEDEDDEGAFDDEDFEEAAEQAAAAGPKGGAYAVFEENDEEEEVVGPRGRRKGPKWKGRRKRGAGLDPVTRRYAIAFGLLSLLFVGWFAYGFYYADRCQNFGAERNFSGKRRSLVRMTVYFARELIDAAPNAAAGLPPYRPPLAESPVAAEAIATARTSYTLALGAMQSYLDQFTSTHRGLLYGNESMGLPATAGRDPEQDALMFESKCLQRSQKGNDCSPSELETLNGLHRLIMRFQGEAEMLMASAPGMLTPTNSHFEFMETYEAAPMQGNLKHSVELYEVEAHSILASFRLGQRAFVAAVTIAVFALYFSVFRGVQQHLAEQARTTVFLMLMIPPDVLQKVPSIRQYLLGDNR